MDNTSYRTCRACGHVTETDEYALELVRPRIVPPGADPGVYHDPIEPDAAPRDRGVVPVYYPDGL